MKNELSMTEIHSLYPVCVLYFSDERKKPIHLIFVIKKTIICFKVECYLSD